MGRLRLGIGEPADRGKGYGKETLKLLTHFAFRELNLFALRATIPEYNLPAIHLFEKSGFIVEIRQRQEIYRDGKYWDLLHVGLLQPEWKAAQ
jgi:RimJ/RimL family protein N-acetyltransferase